MRWKDSGLAARSVALAFTDGNSVRGKTEVQMPNAYTSTCGESPDVEKHMHIKVENIRYNS